MAARRPKVAAPVISLLSSDEENEAPAAPKRPSLSTSKQENIKPGPPKTNPTKQPLKTRDAQPKDAVKPATKAVAKPKASSSSTSSVTAATKKDIAHITLSSTPSPPPKPHLLSYTGPYPKIFGALSSDPILSQSSPPAPLIPRDSVSRSSKPTKKGDIFTTLLDDDSDSGLSSLSGSSDRKRRKLLKGKERIQSSSPDYTLAPGTSAREFLDNLASKNDENKPVVKRRQVDDIVDISDSGSEPEPTCRNIDPSPEPSAPTRRTKLTDAEKEARKAEREAARAQKAAEKEALKEQKKAEKQAKLLQKNEGQAMSIANQLKGSHVETVTEMMVNISSDFHGSRAGTQLQSFLTALNVQHAPFDSTIPCLIKWRRIITTKWDAVDDIFVPIPRQLVDEKHVLAVIEAKAFISLTNTPAELDRFVAKVKSEYPTCKPIIVIEGLKKLVNKSKNDQSRAYAAQVRNRMQDGANETVRVSKAAQAVDEDNVEDALLKLQVVHGCLVCQTVAYMDTAEAISSYTQHISQIPYKLAKATLNKSTNFCMDAGQIPSGKSVDDTFNKMLQCVHMSTQGVANAIQCEYPTVQQLFRAFIDHGEDVLKDIKVSRNGGGRALGPAMSRKIARVLTGTDEWEMES
ncbi:hypothetical protein DRE_02715 [Drechslerella stenobrocha 248]|uniref:ERCC4 domain-containing protein n=1 Tax=Drechslerella stenobrocha 248 TaxID=1043628 RepID=W7HVC5_9PEZI|nr:hypothetical protein DRE_02715 [Drechslerella stenobrocha 248]